MRQICYFTYHTDTAHHGALFFLCIIQKTNHFHTCILQIRQVHFTVGTGSYYYAFHNC